MCWIGGSSPCHRWFRGRGVRTLAVAWSYGSNEPGFHVVLKGGDEFAIGPSRRTDVFLLTTQHDQQVSLD